MKYLKIFILLFISCQFYAQKPDYTFEGKLQVELSQRLQNIGNPEKVDLSNVEVRVVRDNKKTKWDELDAADAFTDNNGNFRIVKSFPQDKNGILPGGDPLQFRVDVRLRNDDLQVVKGGWAKGHWFTVAKVKSKGGGSHQLGNLVFNRNKQYQLNEKLASRHAQIYWIFMKTLDKFEAENVGFPKLVTVNYPHKNIIMADKRAFASLNVYLGKNINPSNNNEPHIMMHELMHLWHVQNLRGNTTPKCIVDGHHKDPDQWNSTLCSGFSEGLAEALGKEISYDIFGDHKPRPHTMWQLRNGKANVSYKIKDLQDAQQTDKGWENLFEYVMRENEWSYFRVLKGVEPSCNPGDVSVYEIMRVIEESDPNIANMTFSKFTDMLNEKASISKRDARIYEKLGNPANYAKQIIEEECKGSMPCTMREDAHQIVITGNEWKGSTNYTISASGNLVQLSGQVDDYDATIQSFDKVTGSKAKGKVSSGVDAFCYTGSLEEIKLSNPCAAIVYVDGKQKEMGCSDCGQNQNSHSIVIAGNEGQRSTKYDLKVSGDIRQIGGEIEGYNATIQGNDNVSDKKAGGKVSTGIDAFCFTGNLENIKLDDPCAAVIYIDGKKQESNCQLKTMELEPELQDFEIDNN